MSAVVSGGQGGQATAVHVGDTWTCRTQPTCLLLHGPLLCRNQNPLFVSTAELLESACQRRVLGRSLSSSVGVWMCQLTRDQSHNERRATKKTPLRPPVALISGPDFVPSSSKTTIQSQMLTRSTFLSPTPQHTYIRDYVHTPKTCQETFLCTEIIVQMERSVCWARPFMHAYMNGGSGPFAGPFGLQRAIAPLGIQESTQQ